MQKFMVPGAAVRGKMGLYKVYSLNNSVNLPCNSVPGSCTNWILASFYSISPKLFCRKESKRSRGYFWLWLIYSHADQPGEEVILVPNCPT